MTGRYNSPIDMRGQNASSPHKLAPIAYGVSLLGGVALRKAGMWAAKKGVKKLIQRNIGKAGTSQIE